MKITLGSCINLKTIDCKKTDPDAEKELKLKLMLFLGYNISGACQLTIDSPNIAARIPVSPVPAPSSRTCFSATMSRC